MDPSTETTGGIVPSPTIPMHIPRTLVLCFDGTADQYDAQVRFYGNSTFFYLSDRICVQNTNVVKFFSLLKKDNNDAQLCYYQVCLAGPP